MTPLCNFPNHIQPKTSTNIKPKSRITNNPTWYATLDKKPSPLCK